jgi:uncharacterized protein YndB with AHSA1/START domain
MTSLPHRLSRSLVIQSSREIVFRFFTDPERWARWWGAGSTIDARAGGMMKIRHANGVEVLGEVLEVAAPVRFAFTYGYESGKPIPLGGSRVTIELESEGKGTRLTLVHEFAEASVRDEFVQGWRFQLSVFANIVANEVNAGASTLVDRWFGLWSITDNGEREQAIGKITSPSIRFRDRYSCLEGIPEILPHIAAAQRFMPQYKPQRLGEIRHCQGMVLAEWTTSEMKGTHVFIFDADGRIESVTGFTA